MVHFVIQWDLPDQKANLTVYANKAKNAWRIWLEPRRLFWRYLTTDPRALYLLLNRSRHSNRTRG